MAGLKSSMASNLSPHFDEHKWVTRIRRTLQEELEEDDDIPVCIFSVPKPLMTLQPDLYTPQQVAVGPYHCLRPELHEMEIYKVAAARRVQKGLDSIKFHHLVDQLCCLEPRIRACYHRYLDFNGDTLAWMMAIDASFLLEFLEVFACREGRALTRVPSRMTHLVDTTGRKSAHNSILRDIAMLENQIPLFVLRKMLEFRFPSPELADEDLLSMLLGLYGELSPFKQSKDLSAIEISRMAHLLEFLFCMIVPELKEISQVVDVDSGMEVVQGEDNSSGNTSLGKRHFDRIQKFFCLLRKVIVSTTVTAVLRLPLTIISNLPGLILLKQTAAYFFSEENRDTKQKDEVACSSDSNMKKPPLIEEIAIPSVTELVKSGVEFSATDGGITSVEFDNKGSVFYLPTIELDVNSEVFLRNLVAYEASNATGPLVLTRYTELMNGIIDTEEDAKLLRERGIILNYLKSDEEVAKLWNEMSKSVRLTKVPFLDKVIEDVNKHYEGNWKVKFGRLMKLYVFGSWQFLIFLASIMILLLLASQTFCSFYRVFRLLNVKPALNT